MILLISIVLGGAITFGLTGRWVNQHSSTELGGRAVPGESTAVANMMRNWWNRSSAAARQRGADWRAAIAEDRRRDKEFKRTNGRGWKRHKPGLFTRLFRSEATPGDTDDSIDEPRVHTVGPGRLTLRLWRHWWGRPLARLITPHDAWPTEADLAEKDDKDSAGRPRRPDPNGEPAPAGPANATPLNDQPAPPAAPGHNPDGHPLCFLCHRPITGADSEPNGPANLVLTARSGDRFPYRVHTACREQFDPQVWRSLRPWTRWSCRICGGGFTDPADAVLLAEPDGTARYAHRDCQSGARRAPAQPTQPDTPSRTDTSAPAAPHSEPTNPPLDPFGQPFAPATESTGNGAGPDAGDATAGNPAADPNPDPSFDSTPTPSTDRAEATEGNHMEAALALFEHAHALQSAPLGGMYSIKFHLEKAAEGATKCASMLTEYAKRLDSTAVNLPESATDPINKAAVTENHVAENLKRAANNVERILKMSPSQLAESGIRIPSQALRTDDTGRVAVANIEFFKSAKELANLKINDLRTDVAAVLTIMSEGFSQVTGYYGNLARRLQDSHMKLDRIVVDAVEQAAQAHAGVPQQLGEAGDAVQFILTTPLGEQISAKIRPFHEDVLPSGGGSGSAPGGTSAAAGPANGTGNGTSAGASTGASNGSSAFGNNTGGRAGGFMPQPGGQTSDPMETPV